MTIKNFPASIKPVYHFLLQPVLVILWVGLLTYGIFIPLLGYFWDDLFIHWVAEVYGASGLGRYFFTNRPVLGMIYQLTTPVLGDSPWVWQVFGIFWRWVAATGVYFLLRELWRDQKDASLWAALLFVIYPGFGQQFMGMMYGHIFIVLSALFYSFVFNLRALRNPQKKILFQGLGLFLSAVNLFTLEYFFVIELLRPALIGFSLYQTELKQPRPFKRILLHWMPYLILFVLAGLWRVFFYDYQTEHYQLNTLQSLASDPFGTILGILQRAGQDFWTTMILAWGNAFQLPDLKVAGNRALLLLAVFTLLTFIFLMFYFFIFKRGQGENKPGWHQWWWTIALSLAAFILAGVPFWATGLPIHLVFAFDRLTIPFMLTFSMLWTAVLFLLPLNKYVRSLVFIILISFSTSHQLQTGINYQHDWDQQARMFWQLTWRAPSIKEGTIIFAHELPLTYYSDNSLTAAINWIYNPDGGEDPESIPYALYYPSVRLGETFEDLQPDREITHDFLVGEFTGNTSRSLAIYYNPPGCLRVLDPEIEENNWMVPLEVRETIHLTDLSRIVPEPQAVPPVKLYGSEPSHTWCYYFEKADLARQIGNWDEVVRLADVAFDLGDYPNDPAERTPFIEGYAHAGRWAEALDQTLIAAEVSPQTHPVLCKLWERIDRQTLPGGDHERTVAAVFEMLECASQP